MTTLPDLKIWHAKMPEGNYRSDLKRFLFVGGASLNARWGVVKIERGDLGGPQMERLDLLLAIKDELQTQLISGGRLTTITGILSYLNYYFQFLDENGLACSLDILESTYLDFAEHLFRRVHQKPSRLKEDSAYIYAAILSNVFGRILTIPDATPLIARTRLKSSKKVKKGVSKAAEKQNLSDTFRLGRFLVALTEGLTVNSILGQLPLTIPMEDGVVENNQVQLGPEGAFSSNSADKWLYSPRRQLSRAQKGRHAKLLQIRQPIHSIEGTKRWMLVNLRVMAEFLVFIAQTGLNRAPALYLKRERFKYKLAGDSWEVRSYKEYKHRRGGEILFKIYVSYKPLLQKYLTFIGHFFPESEWLFPWFVSDKVVSAPSSMSYHSLKRALKAHHIPWNPPRTVRNTRVNWILRRSGDPDITAEMAQHSKEVLRDDYEQPSQQRAMVEITRFWDKHDPIKKADLKDSVIDGQCDGKPEAVDNKPFSVVEPNCVNASGCLWCKHRRDLNSEDYVWSLTSFRYLKTLEASSRVTPEEIPADLVIIRLSEMLSWYRNTSKERAAWVEEAGQRIEEGYYHPNWSRLIDVIETVE